MRVTSTWRLQEFLFHFTPACFHVCGVNTLLLSVSPFCSLCCIISQHHADLLSLGGGQSVFSFFFFSFYSWENMATPSYNQERWRREPWEDLKCRNILFHKAKSLKILFRAGGGGQFRTNHVIVLQSDLSHSHE